jgi:hypothetical protein
MHHPLEERRHRRQNIQKNFNGIVFEFVARFRVKSAVKAIPS